MREDIETSYNEKLKQVYENIEKLIGEKDIDKNQVLEHDNYVDELSKYFEESNKLEKKIMEEFKKVQYEG